MKFFQFSLSEIGCLQKYLYRGGMCFLVFGLTGCGDFFSTTPVTPRPENINQHDDLLRGEGTITYRMEESLSTGPVPQSVPPVSVQRIEFSNLGDSLLDGEEYIQVAMKIFEWQNSTAHTSTIFLAAAGEDGVFYFPDSGALATGPRFFSLKISTQATKATEESYYTLPNLLLTEGPLKFSNGDFDFERRVAGIDTLEYQQRLEEVWKVSETVSHKTVDLIQSTYFYGASGLLSGTQNFTSFEARSSLGVSRGKGSIVRTFTLI